MLAFWSLFGLVIGIVAAQRRGFNIVAGALAGLIVGPFAVLMFFVDGILSSSERRVICPYCQERVKPQAIVCPHCQRDIPPQPITRSAGAKIARAVVLGIIGLFVVLLAIQMIAIYR